MEIHCDYAPREPAMAVVIDEIAPAR